jgi:hypothetical protein
MSKEKPVAEKKSSPQYFMIHKSEPQYDLIKSQLLDSSRSPAGLSNYFIWADQDNCCICRIRAGNSSVLFYEILNHPREGISDEDIRDAVRDPSNACSLPGYFYVTPNIKEKLHEVPLIDTAGHGTGTKNHTRRENPRLVSHHKSADTIG